MTPLKELVKMLDGRKEGEETTKEIEKFAKEHDLVILYGYSDDNVEIRGAVHEEVGAWDGTTLFFDEKGLFQNECDNDRCPYHEDMLADKHEVQAISHFGEDEAEYCWSFITDIPHEVFDVMDSVEGIVFCKGIVFSLDNLI